jgi:hypothetical protein
MSVRVFPIDLARDQGRFRSTNEQFAARGLLYEGVEGPHDTADLDDLKPYFPRPDGQVASKLLRGEVGGMMQVITDGDTRFSSWMTTFFPKRYPDVWPKPPAIG